MWNAKMLTQETDTRRKKNEVFLDYFLVAILQKKKERKKERKQLKIED